MLAGELPFLVDKAVFNGEDIGQPRGLRAYSPKPLSLATFPVRGKIRGCTVLYNSTTKGSLLGTEPNCKHVTGGSEASPDFMRMVPPVSP